MLRAHQLRCAALIGGYARTAEAQALVRSRWAHDLVAARPVVRARSPRVVALEDSGYAQERDPAARTARLPSMALRAARTALEAGSPVLVQVPRRGYVPALACAPLPDHRPLPALHRPVVAARSRHRRGGVPVVWPRRTGVALRAVRFRRGARGRRRRPPHRRGTRPGVSRHHRHHVGRRRDGGRRARGTGRRRRDTRRRAGRRRRLRRRAAAGQLGAARPAGPARLRGHPAALDGRRRAGAPSRRRRGGRGGRRVGDSDRAGADPLGSGRPRRRRTRLPRRGRVCHPRCTWPPSTARPKRCTRCSTPPNCPTPPSCWDPSTCRRAPVARRARLRTPGEPDAGAGAPRRRTRARGGAAPGHRRAQRAARSTAGSCANRPVAHRVVRTAASRAGQEVGMRRVFAWLIPLALIAIGLLWPLVFSGGSEASDVDDPVVFSNYQADYIVSEDGRLDAVETITARVSRRAARHLPVLGRRQPEQPACAADAGGHLDPARRRVGVLPDAVGGRRAVPGGQDRRSRRVPRRPGTHVFEIRYTIAGVLDPGTTGADKTFAAVDRRRRRIRRRCSSGTSSRRRGTTRSNGPTSRSRCPVTSRGAQCSVGFGVGTRLPRPGRRRQHGRVVGAEPAAAHAGDAACRGRRADPAPSGVAVAVHLGPHPRPVA